MRLKEIFKNPLIIFIILNISDAIITYIWLKDNYISTELNPIYRYLFVEFGKAEGLFILKFIGILFVIYVYYFLITKDGRPTLIKAFKYINIIFLIVVISNLVGLIQTFIY